MRRSADATGEGQNDSDSSRFEYSGDDARARRGDEVVGVRACDERYDAHDVAEANSSGDSQRRSRGSFAPSLAAAR